jgi:hypothetical protein
MLADEKPGANLMAEPRDEAVPAPMVGRAIAGLAEALLLHLRIDTEPSRDHARDLAQHLSMLGQMISEAHGLPTHVPKALVNRITSQLDQAANLPQASPNLAAALKKDAMRLRGLT